MDRRVHPSPWLTPDNADYSKFLISVEYMGAIERSLFETVRKHSFLGVHEVTLDLGRLFDRIMEFGHNQSARAAPGIWGEFQHPNYLEILPHDVKIQILYWMPDVATLISLANANIGYEVPFQSASKAITTRVTLRQLKANRFDISHPMLDIIHYLGYPQSLAPHGELYWFDGLKPLRELVLGRRNTLEIEHCLMLLEFGHDDYCLNLDNNVLHLLRIERE
ncbi:hypothetical protein G7Y79_00029g063280 [Physcia stellaris]|nr:hypothetical protein G7Y79_00029g063280 [Physcia stellaris]